MTRPRLLEPTIKRTVVLPPEADRRIREIAAQQGSNSSQVMRTALLCWLREQSRREAVGQ